MKQLLLFFCIALSIQITSWSQCPDESNLDSDGDGVLDCIDPCINMPSSKIGNLSFESDFIGWTIPQNQSYFSISTNTDNLLHGNKSLYVNAPSASVFENHAIYTEEFILEEGIAYNFKIPVKRIGSNDGDALRWVLIDENGIYRHFNNYYSSTENWTFITFENFMVNFSTYTSNKFRLRLEFGLSTNDMIIDKIEFYESSEIEDPAYKDLNGDGDPDCTPFSAADHLDYDALVAIYNALDGNNWYSKANWLDLTKPISTWFGITETNGRVTGINLGVQNNVNGSLPNEITNLKELESLWIQGNNLTGDIPINIGNLSKLRQLVLSQTYGLTGNIPASIVNCNNLEILVLSNNQLEGNIPDLTGLSSLNTLYIDNNNFQYGDAEDEFLAYQNQMGSSFVYSPQNFPYIEADSRVINIGENITFNSSPVSGNNNIYTWYLNDVIIDANTQPNITGLNTPSIQINNVTQNQLGSYKCYVSNSIITGLQIYAGELNIGLNPESHPDYDALVAIYNALNGIYWHNKTNWLDTTKPISSWFGITETNGRVTKVDLGYQNNVTGNIPQEIGDLSELEYLWIQNAFLSGEIPSSIGNLSKLRQIVLFETRGITGVIPSSIINCTNLEWLYLSNNKLSGTIPNLNSLTNLSVLAIDFNNFVFSDFENEFNAYTSKMGNNFTYSPQRTITDVNSEAVEIGNSTTLSSVLTSVNNNYVWYRVNADGSQVNIIGGNSSSLNVTINSASDYQWSYYYVATNSIITGLTLTSAYYKIDDLPSNSPDYNALVALYNNTNGDNWTQNTNWLDSTKPLVSWYGIQVENNRVTQLNLGRNNLTGNLPQEIGGFSELTDLNLWSNQLEGNIPPEIGNLSKLVNMDLSPNTFSGNIPSEIGNLINLEILWLNQNGLTGTIPTSFQNLTKLRRLYLQGSVGEGSEFSSSAFSGDFPDLTTLPLELLWINDNFFKFTDIADEFATYKANIPDFRFNPQFTIDPPIESNISVGDNVTLTLTDIPSTAKGMIKKVRLANNSYQWFKDGIALTINANTNTYVINNAQESDSGIYHCEITNTDIPDMIIKRQSITLNIGTLNVEEIDKNQIKIYPNPTNNILNIKLNNTKITNSALYNISGKRVLNLELHSDLTVIDLSNLSPGIYLLKMNILEKTVVKRIIKQ